MRFLHCADLHLGKSFGRFDEMTRADLRAARLNTLRDIAAIATEQNVDCVLIAGDTFDAQTPPSKLVKRVIDIMAETPVQWVLMPGNHDSLAATDLWERIERDKPDNVILALSPDVITIKDAAILPAPPTARSAGFDLTDWMTHADTGQNIRIGLAHGGVTDFGSEGGGLDTIPPDRAERSNLDYLALGDWHGQMRITDRTWYSGTPEPDGFKHSHETGVLLVEITARGDAPIVTNIPTGRFRWRRIEPTFFASNDPTQIVETELPSTDRARHLIKFVGSGRLRLAELAQLRSALDAVDDDFHDLDVDLTAISIEENLDDLNLIAETGALRVAAENLFDQTQTDGRSPEDAQIAKLALSHLFHLAQEVKS